MRLYPRVPQPFMLIGLDDARTDFCNGDALRFGIRLFGQAADLSAYLVLAFKGIGQNGLGRDRIRYTIVSVVDGDGRRVLAEGQSQVAQVASAKLTIGSQDGVSGPAALHLVSPLRLRAEGRIQQEFDFSIFFRSLLRRLKILSYFYGHPLDPRAGYEILDLADGIEVTDQQVEWWEISRFSGRQQRHVKLGGLVGQVRLEGDLTPFAPWLKAGEICGVGKATSFGLGQIALSEC